MLGEALRLIRTYNDLKQNELADSLQISKSYLSEIENGKKIPPLEIIKKYSEQFSIPVSSILFFSEELQKAKSGEKIRIKIAKSIIGFLKVIENKATDEQ